MGDGAGSRDGLPPRGIVKEVKAHCERRGIILRVNGRGVGDAPDSGMHPTADTRAVKYL